MAERRRRGIDGMTSLVGEVGKYGSMMRDSTYGATLDTVESTSSVFMGNPRLTITQENVDGERRTLPKVIKTSSSSYDWNKREERQQELRDVLHSAELRKQIAPMKLVFDRFGEAGATVWGGLATARAAFAASRRYNRRDIAERYSEGQGFKTVASVEDALIKAAANAVLSSDYIDIEDMGEEEQAAARWCFDNADEIHRLAAHGSVADITKAAYEMGQRFGYIEPPKDPNQSGGNKDGDSSSGGNSPNDSSDAGNTAQKGAGGSPSDDSSDDGDSSESGGSESSPDGSDGAGGQGSGEDSETDDEGDSGGGEDSEGSDPDGDEGDDDSDGSPDGDETDSSEGGGSDDSSGEPSELEDLLDDLKELEQEDRKLPPKPKADEQQATYGSGQQNGHTWTLVPNVACVRMRTPPVLTQITGDVKVNSHKLTDDTSGRLTNWASELLIGNKTVFKSKLKEQAKIVIAVDASGSVGTYASLKEQYRINEEAKVKQFLSFAKRRGMRVPPTDPRRVAKEWEPNSGQFKQLIEDKKRYLIATANGSSKSAKTAQAILNNQALWDKAEELTAPGIDTVQDENVGYLMWTAAAALSESFPESRVFSYRGDFNYENCDMQVAEILPGHRPAQTAIEVNNSANPAIPNGKPDAKGRRIRHSFSADNGTPECAMWQLMGNLLKGEMQGAVGVIITDGQPNDEAHVRKLASEYYQAGIQIAVIEVGGGRSVEREFLKSRELYKLLGQLSLSSIDKSTNNLNANQFDSRLAAHNNKPLYPSATHVSVKTMSDLPKISAVMNMLEQTR